MRSAGGTVLVGSAEFTEAIEQLLDDAQWMEEMGNAAKERSLGLHRRISQEGLIRTHEKLFSGK